jgi:hypothetical protein
MKTKDDEMKKIILFLVAFLFITAANASELLIFSAQNCPPCKAWEMQVRPTFAEKYNIPIIIYKSGDKLRKRYHFNNDITRTPTFVLVDDNGHELGRINGYLTPDIWYKMFDNLLEMVKK